MDGMTSAAFRSVCFEYGAQGATTEMIPAVSFALVRLHKRPLMRAMVLRRPEEKYLAAQLIGSDPSVMAAAAVRLEELNRFDAIEINMGCPARKVNSSGNGAALLADPTRAGEILRAVCSAVRMPVRLKMRLGTDGSNITAPEIARMAQDAGCSMLILHGRTRAQLYEGEVMLEEMLRVRDAVQIPVYANGAVVRAADAPAFAQAARADGVCIGRAALKSPWIFEDIRALERGEAIPERDAHERIGLILRIADRLCMQKPEHFALQEMRKFCRWYMSGLTGAQEAFDRIKTVEGLEAFRAVLEGYLNELVRRNDIHVHPELMTEDSLDTVRRG